MRWVLLQGGQQGPLEYDDTQAVMRVHTWACAVLTEYFLDVSRGAVHSPLPDGPIRKMVTVLPHYTQDREMCWGNRRHSKQSRLWKASALCDALPIGTVMTCLPVWLEFSWIP